MEPLTITLHIVISCLFAAFAVVGILFPFRKNGKFSKTAVFENILLAEKTGEKETDEEENEEHAGKKRTITLKAAVVFSSVASLLIVGIGLWLMFFFQNADILFLAKRVALVSVLVVAAYYDFAAFRIPNKLILYGIGCRVLILLFELIFARDLLSEVLLSEGIALLSMIALAAVCMLITRRGLGMGDVKLFVLMALMQGIAGVISSLFGSLLVAFVFSVFLLLFKKKSKKDFIPFAPCILIGSFISIVLLGA